VFDWKKNDALEIELKRADKGKPVADFLESIYQNPSTFRLYNVDLAPEQQYFLEKDLFPLACVHVQTNGDEITSWKMMDNVEATDYVVPKLNVMGLEIKLADQVPRMDSRLSSVTLTPEIYHEDAARKSILVEGRDEGNILAQVENEVQKFDPDFIITSNGDSFVFPIKRGK